MAFSLFYYKNLLKLNLPDVLQVQKAITKW